MRFVARNERKHKVRRKQQLQAARDLATFGPADIQEELKLSPNSEELLKRQGEQKLLAEQKLKQMQLRNLEEANLAGAFNWIRDGEHNNKLFFQGVDPAPINTRLPRLSG